MVQLFACFMLCVALASLSFCQTAQSDEEVLDLIQEGARLRTLDRWSDAERVLLSALAKATAQGSGLAVAAAANELGWVYQDLGRIADAERYYRMASRIAGEHGNPSRVLAAANNLACLYIETGQNARLDHLNIAELARQVGEGPQVTRAKSILASVAMGKGRFAEAESLFNEVLPVFESTGRYLDAAITLGNMGVIDLRTGRIPAAVGNLERCVALLELHSLGGPVLMKSLTNLGVSYARAGRKSEAAELAERAARLSEAAFGDNSPATAAILTECSYALKEAGRKPEAKRLQKKADGILRALNIPNQRGTLVDVSDLLPRSKPGK